MRIIGVVICEAPDMRSMVQAGSIRFVDKLIVVSGRYPDQPSSGSMEIEFFSEKDFEKQLGIEDVHIYYNTADWKGPDEKLNAAISCGENPTDDWFLVLQEGDVLRPVQLDIKEKLADLVSRYGSMTELLIPTLSSGSCVPEILAPSITNPLWRQSFFKLRDGMYARSHRCIFTITGINTRDHPEYQKFRVYSPDLDLVISNESNKWNSVEREAWFEEHFGADHRSANALASDIDYAIHIPKGARLV